MIGQLLQAVHYHGGTGKLSIQFLPTAPQTLADQLVLTEEIP